MKKALIIVEPRIGISSSVALNEINRVRNFFELGLWASPLIRKVARSHQASVISVDESLPHGLAEQWRIPVLEAKHDEKGVSRAYGESIRLSREWHVYGKLPELLQIRGINIAEALEGMMWFKFFPLFKQIELADRLFEEESVDAVYLESDLFSSGQAFAAVAAARGISCHFLQPLFYRKVKSRLRTFRSYRTTKAVLRWAALYLIPGQSGNEPRYRVLADIPSYTNYFSAVAPAIQELLDRDACQCYVIGEEAHVRRKFPQARPVNVAPQAASAEYEGPVGEIRRYYHCHLEKDPGFHQLFTYHGLNLWSIIKEDVDYLFSRTLADLVFNMARFDEVLELAKPDVMVVGFDESSAVRGHVLMAKKTGIPVLEVQHGMFSPLSQFARPISDVVAAAGDYSKDIYIKSGLQPGQIVVTGWPKFDVYTKLREEVPKENSRNILFATGPVHLKMNLDIIECIGSWTEASEDLRLIVKPHPYETEEVYRRVTEKYRHVALCRSDEDIVPILAAADVLLMEASTVGIEAAILGKPIVFIDLGTGTGESIFVSSGVAIKAAGLFEVVPAIEDVLLNEQVRKNMSEARKKFVYDHAYLQDGQASRRVADLIIRMIENQEPGGVDAK